MKLPKAYYVNAKGVQKPLLLPKLDFFLTLMKKKEYFKYLRFCHGWMDWLKHHFKLKRYVRLIKRKEYDKIALDLYSFKTKDPTKLFNQWVGNIDKDTFTYITTNVLEVQYEYCKYDDILLGLINSEGFEYVSPSSKKAGSKAENFMNHMMQFSEKPYLHGGLPKHYSVMREWESFFTQVDALKVPVIFIGPPYGKHYASSYGIKRFKCIPIPSRHAALEVHKIVQRTIKTINATPTEPLILGSASQLCSSIVLEAKRGANKDFFFMDIGKALDLKPTYEKKIKGKGRWIQKEWVPIHQRWVKKQRKNTFK